MKKVSVKQLPDDFDVNLDKCFRRPVFLHLYILYILYYMYNNCIYIYIYHISSEVLFRVLNTCAFIASVAVPLHVFCDILIDFVTLES